MDHNQTYHRTPVEDSDITTALIYLNAIQRVHKTDRRRALASLQDLVRDGEPPAQPLHGRYAGRLLAFDIAPGLTKLADAIAARWHFWLGKTFDAPQGIGDDIYLRTLLRRARIFWPGYHDYVVDTAETWRVFPFRTTLATSLINPSLPVLRLDYDLPMNPRLSVARTMDEIVQLAANVYVGRAFIHWWWGQWQPVAYFMLRPALPLPTTDTLLHELAD